VNVSNRFSPLGGWRWKTTLLPLETFIEVVVNVTNQVLPFVYYFITPLAHD
jgi:hypothetical protein